MRKIVEVDSSSTDPSSSDSKEVIEIKSDDNLSLNKSIVSELDFNYCKDSLLRLQ